MHSPVNFIVVNEIAAGRIARAEAHRQARNGKPAAAQAKRAPRLQGLKLFRRARIA